MIHYMNYKTERMRRRGHHWDPALHKREAFKNEQEVRALRHDPEDWIRAQEEASEKFSLDTHIGLPWNPQAVIEQIIVNPQSPSAYIDTVRGAVARVDPALAALVIHSELGSEPIRY